MQYVQQFLTEFWDLAKEMSPYLLLGFLFAGLLHVYFPTEKVKKYLGHHNKASVLNAALLGIPLPLCSCGVIPTGVSFFKSGASRGSSVSFLISTPQTGVDSILATYSLMGLPFAIVRPLIALVTGVAGGWITDKSTSGAPENTEPVTVAPAGHKEEGNKLVSLLNYAFVDFLNDISKWLFIGLLLAALIAVVIPDGFFTEYITNEYLGLLLILLISVPMYVCATGSIPIAAVLLAKGVSPGAALVFLMAGPATNVATMVVIGKVMGRKTLAMYLLSIIGGAIIFGVLVNEITPLRAIFGNVDQMGHAHVHFIPEWLKTASAILLGILMINGVIKFRKGVKIKPEMKTNEQVSITVDGMTCNHCKNAVESGISGVEGVEEAVVDLAAHKVHISGKEVDLDKIASVVQQLGYEYKGKQ